MNVRLKRARELAGYAVQLTKDEGLGTMLARGAGFVRRRCFGTFQSHIHGSGLAALGGLVGRADRLGDVYKRQGQKRPPLY